MDRRSLMLLFLAVGISGIFSKKDSDESYEFLYDELEQEGILEPDDNFDDNIDENRGERNDKEHLSEDEISFSEDNELDWEDLNEEKHIDIKEKRDTKKTGTTKSPSKNKSKTTASPTKHAATSHATTTTHPRTTKSSVKESEAVKTTETSSTVKPTETKTATTASTATTKSFTGKTSAATSTSRPTTAGLKGFDPTIEFTEPEKEIMELAKRLYHTMEADILVKLKKELKENATRTDAEKNTLNKASAGKSDASKTMVINVPQPLRSDSDEHLPSDCLEHDPVLDYPNVYVSRHGALEAAFHDDDHSGRGFLLRDLESVVAPNTELALEFKFSKPVPLLAIKFKDADELDGVTDVLLETNRVKAGKWRWLKGRVGETARVFSLNKNGIRLELVAEVSGVRIYPQEWTNQPIIPRPDFIQCTRFDDD